MKYKTDGTIIPHDKRKEINEKILYLVEQGIAEESGITREDIFNAYTGDGGLHGLNFNDFDNFHEYTEAKKEIENGQFFTPYALCQIIMDALHIERDKTVADLTSGISSFCNYTPVESNFYGCELDIKSFKVSKYLYPTANIEHKDIRFYSPYAKFDYIVGNPPFNLHWEVDGDRWLSQMYYCIKASQLLNPLGIMAIVVPKSFLDDDFSNKAMIKEMESMFDFLGQASVSASAFKHLGVDDFGTKVMFWQKPISGAERIPYSVDIKFEIDLGNIYDSVNRIYKEFIYTGKERIKSHSAQLKRLAYASQSDDFRYEVNKMMYHIKTNPKLADKYAKCKEYLYKFENQTMPEGMKYDEWAKVRITEAKVLAYLRRVLKSQNKKPPVDKIALVKQDHAFVYKAYSRKSAKELTENHKKPVPISSIVYNGNASSGIMQQYGKMLRRKMRDYEIEQKPFAEMEQDDFIASWLDDFVIYDSENDVNIYLNDTQKHDINLILQKKRSLLQWEQGSGKTLAGIACGKYRMQFQNAKNVWVVSTAISIKNNWDCVLDSYGIPYIMIKSLRDIESIQDGQFVIITLNMLCKYQKKIKQAIKKCGQKICLVFDESDEMSNPTSKRTKAVLNCFRKCNYKLLMTGTVTRNNISECAPQLELLFNNSYNMISECEYIYTNDKKEDSLSIEQNMYYGLPIPAYRNGYSLFSASHLPEKITVFGVGQKTQDIYNADALNRILERCVITRTFKEVSGKDILRPHQEPVRFSSAEAEVYRGVIEEFYRFRDGYFASTGNARKDAMMRLIQQIELLLRVCAAPNTMKEYGSTETPTKIRKVMDMCSKWNDEIVVIGVRHKNVVDAYANEIRERFPNRKLFVVTGSTTTLAQRKALKEKLRNSKNGILVCTQQSLPSSVNFEYVNKIVIPELHYNNAKMSQFYYRFIRYTSTDFKDVYFVTYAGSIESNQMQMVIAKEKLNLFMKGKDTNLDEIYKEFGVDYNLLSMLMTREADSEGHLHIRWGEQEIK